MILLLALLAGCLEPTTTSVDCAACHGGEWSAAPPAALGGITDPAYVGVGAHRAHLLGSTLGIPVACEECHVVPATPDAEGHTDTPWPAEVVWGDLAKTGGLVGTWDRETLTCSNVYCHGAGLAGGSDPAPVWTLLDGSQVGCDSCHGSPPPPPHPDDAACHDCHAPTAQPDGTVDPATHVDGTLQVVDEQTCVDCHGEGDNPAPPPDTSGETDPEVATVGAHDVHVLGQGDGAAVACGDCHPVPDTVDAPGHLDGAPAEVVLSGVAAVDSEPAWDAQALTCSDTWCHGGATPVWNVVDGSQAPCGSCHGLPPPPPHPSSDACEGCHGSVAGAGQTISDPSKHVDGTVDF